MTRGVRRAPDGGAVLRLDSRERLALRQLCVELQVRLGTRPALGGPPNQPEPSAPPLDPLEAMLGNLGAGAGEDPRLPRDPVLARLLPDAYDSDLDGGRAAGEFRRFTEAELRDTKSQAAQTVLETLADDRSAKVVLTAEQAEIWTAALNDLRLSLGVALGVSEDHRRRRDLTDPLYPRAVVYDWLTWLQASLLEVLDR